MTRSAWRDVPAVVLTRAVGAVQPPAAAALGAVVTVAALLPAALALASGWLVDVIARSPGGVDRYAGPVAVLGVVFLLLQVLPPAAQALAELLGRRLGRCTSSRVMAALERPARIDQLEDPATADLVSAVDGGVGGATARDAVVGLASVTIARAGAAVAGLVLLGYRWWLALLLLAAYGYATLGVSRVYHRQLEAAEGLPARLRRAVYLKDLLCSATAGKEVRVFGLADWVLDRYQEEWLGALSDTRRSRRGATRASLLAAGLVLLAQGLAFVLLTLDLVHGRIDVGAFTAYAVAATSLLGMMVTSPDLVNLATGGLVLQAVDELEARTAAAAAPATSLGPVPTGSPTVTFEGVGFRYPGSAGFVLRGLDLTLPARSSTAIVGVNGAGKTTLVKLLCGLYQPTEGRILVDGVDLAGLDPRAWQRRCAALFQDWVRWELPVRDNVLLGAIEADPDPAALSEVASSAGLDEVLADLPAGWETVLSRQFGGVDLSGGQWQRVGLARALWAARARAGVLVLDEPTSALDVRGETELYDRLIGAARDQTVVLVSHRLSTVRHADQILVLAGGRVVERGDHAALLAAGGRYAAMFRVQAERFTGQGAAR